MATRAEREYMVQARLFDGGDNFGNSANTSSSSSLLGSSPGGGIFLDTPSSPQSSSAYGIPPSSPPVHGQERFSEESGSSVVYSHLNNSDDHDDHDISPSSSRERGSISSSSGSSSSGVRASYEHALELTHEYAAVATRLSQNNTSVRLPQQNAIFQAWERFSVVQEQQLNGLRNEMADLRRQNDRLRASYQDERDSKDVLVDECLRLRRAARPTTAATVSLSPPSSQESDEAAAVAEAFYGADPARAALGTASVEYRPECVVERATEGQHHVSTSPVQADKGVVVESDVGGRGRIVSGSGYGQQRTVRRHGPSSNGGGSRGGRSSGDAGLGVGRGVAAADVRRSDDRPLSGSSTISRERASNVRGSASGNARGPAAMKKTRHTLLAQRGTVASRSRASNLWRLCKGQGSSPVEQDDGDGDTTHSSCPERSARKIMAASREASPRPPWR